jgi:hypothetical protein
MLEKKVFVGILWPRLMAVPSFSIQNVRDQAGFLILVDHIFLVMWYQNEQKKMLGGKGRGGLVGSAPTCNCKSSLGSNPDIP